MKNVPLKLFTWTVYRIIKSDTFVLRSGMRGTPWCASYALVCMIRPGMRVSPRVTPWYTAGLTNKPP